jgi:peptidoglycan/LPS O-acetylase OafA/YrhL
MNYGYTAIDVLLAFLLSGSLLDINISKPLIKVLSNKLLIWAGKYSYGIYVYHWIFMQTIIPKADELLPNEYYFLIRVLGIMVVCLISYLSFHLWEKRFLSMKKFFP